MKNPLENLYENKIPRVPCRKEKDLALVQNGSNSNRLGWKFDSGGFPARGIDPPWSRGRKIGPDLKMGGLRGEVMVKRVGGKEEGGHGRAGTKL